MFFLRIVTILLLFIVAETAWAQNPSWPLLPEPGEHDGISKTEIIRLGISAVTVFESSAVQRRTEYDSSGHMVYDSSTTSVDEYRYDSLGRVVLKTVRHFDVDEGEKTVYVRHSYDTSGRRVETRTTDFYGTPISSLTGRLATFRYAGDTIFIRGEFGSGAIVSRRDENWRLLEFTMVEGETMSRQVLVTYEPCRSITRSFKYGARRIHRLVVDSCARASERADEFTDGRKGSVNRRTIHDEAMRPLRVEFLGFDGSVSHLNIHSYDENGLPTTIRKQSFMPPIPGANDSTKTILETIERYEYEYRAKEKENRE